MTTRKSHKQRGATFETNLRDWFRKRGYKAERLARTGKNDEGDISVENSDTYYVVEAKAPGASGRIDLSGWLKEADVEAANYTKHRSLKTAARPVLIIKARGKSIDKAYVVTRLEEYPW
jgi:Holliday junction resolvase